MNDVGFFPGLIVGILVTAIFCSWLVSCNLRQQAIDAGVAQWIIDSKTGETSFVYGCEDKP